VPSFLSDGWLDRARSLLDDLSCDPDLTFRVGYVFELRDGSRHLAHEVEKGRLVRWEFDAASEPEVAIRWPRDVALEFFLGRSEAEAMHRAVTISEQRDGALWTGPPPPLDLSARPEVQLLPRIPGANLVCQYRLREGPFGDIFCWFRFEEGQFRSLELGEAAEADTVIDTTFTAMVRMRRGEIAPLQAIQAGGVAGSWEKLALQSGIVEGAEYQRAIRACGTRGAEALAAFGRYRATPEVAEALHVLASETDLEEEAMTA
jgi:hypothetical protein